MNLRITTQLCGNSFSNTCLKLFTIFLIILLAIASMICIVDAIEPNDPLYGKDGGYSFYGYEIDQWLLEKINAPTAWDISTGNPSIKVAIVEGKFYYEHEDLRENVYEDKGLNFHKGGYYADYSDHASGCAGLVGAVGNNNIGCSGVNWHVTLVSGQYGYTDINELTGEPIINKTTGEYVSISCSPEEWEYGLEKLIDDYGVKVISMSFIMGVENNEPYLLPNNNAKAVENIIKKYQDKVLFVAAAGNSGDDDVYYPAEFATYYVSINAVGAVDEYDRRSVWNENESSNYGKEITIVAPGSDITTTSIEGENPSAGTYSSYFLNTPHTYPFGGTSAATPIVAGAAALIWSINP